MNIPVLLMADSYKLGHHLMYPEKMEFLQANITPRSNRHLRKSKFHDNKIVVMGVSAVMHEFFNQWEDFFSMSWNYIEGEISGVIRATDKNYDFNHFKKLHELGRLPLCIQHIPDGELVDIGVPIVLVESEELDFAWLVNFCETMLLNMIWHPCTTATVAREYRLVMDYYANKTADNNLITFVDWQGHDFSLRGMEGMQAGAMSGLGHLAFFKGTDNMAACYLANKCYNANNDFGSVYATEHSVATSNIQFIKSELENLSSCNFKELTEDDQLSECEYWFLRELLEKFPENILSYVTDSYDYWGVLERILPKLKDEILSRVGTLVIRPDSGDPIEIICGKKQSYDYQFKDLEEACEKLIGIASIDAEEQLRGRGADDTLQRYFDYIVSVGNKLYSVELSVEYDSYGGDPFSILCVTDVEVFNTTELPLSIEEKGSIQYLWELFGGTINEKGYKVLDSHIRLIYGDGITIERLEEILSRLEEKGFSSENVVFGIGSYPYQSVTRDTLGFAYKATYCQVDTNSIPVYKSPKTDQGKRSLKGYITLHKEDGVWKYYEHNEEQNDFIEDELIVYTDSEFYNRISLREIREKLKNSFDK